METRSLIEAGETLTTEFKSEALNHELTKAAACLANGDGGVLLIGVDDDGTVVGARGPGGSRPDPELMAAYIQNTTDPPLPVTAELEQIDGEDVVRIEVPRGDPGPVGTKSGVFTRRSIDTNGRPQCLPMSAHEIVSLGMVTRGQDFAAAAAAGATVEDDLDPDEFKRFRRLCATSGDHVDQLSDRDVLKALGLEPLQAPVSLGAVLLFGRRAAVQRWTPNAELLFQDLRGTSRTNRRLVGPLLQVAEELARLLDERNTSHEFVIGLHRVDIPLIPSVTRREAVANALVHRDYSALGPTTVQLTDAEFAVSSPGGFPPGVTVDNILEQSRPRSPLLADAFKRAGLVERRGKGVNDMFEQQLRAGRDSPDYTRSTPDSVTVTVPLGTADLDLVRFLLAWEDERQQALGLPELQVVHEVKAAGSAGSHEIASMTGLPVGRARAVATHLVEMGILEARGDGRSRRYHLTARFYDRAQDRNAYVRVKGVDPLQQERMILDYVDAFGSITRGRAAELCQTSPPQARTILKRLVDGGRLRVVGERRTARYEAVDGGA